MADPILAGWNSPRNEEVAAFLAQHSGRTARDLEPFTDGAFSSAWASRVGDEELVIRFGPHGSWFEADRMAMAINGPNLPVPRLPNLGREHESSGTSGRPDPSVTATSPRRLARGPCHREAAWLSAED
jgi:hypothetical protein